MDTDSERKPLCEDKDTDLLYQKNIKGFLFVFPLMTLGALASSQLNTMVSQLVYKLVSENQKDYGNHTYLNRCDILHNVTDDIIQTEAMNFRLYMRIVGAITALISLPLLGALSDYKGRYVTAIAIIMGIMLFTLCMLVICVVPGTPLWTLIVGELLYGLLGRGAPGLFMVSSAIITDVIPNGRRTFMMITKSFLYFISTTAASIGTGYWIKESGFIPVLIAFLCVDIILLFYAMLILPKVCVIQQPKATEEGNPVLIKFRKYFVSPYTTYFKPREGHLRACLVLCLLYRFIQAMAIAGMRNILTIYSLGPPLCWDASVLGSFGSVEAAFQGLIPMTLALYTVKQKPSPWLVLVGQLAGAISSVVFGVARTTTTMFVGIVIFSPRVLVASVSRSLVSDLVLPTEQGVVMSGQVTVAIFGGLVANMVYNSVYVGSISSCRHCFFFLSTVLCSLGIVVLGCFAFIRRRYVLTNESVESSDPGTDAQK